jgi:putative ATP-binding cassette transporter
MNNKMALVSILFKENPVISYYLIVLSICAGILSGSIIFFVINGIHHIVDGNHVALYAFLIPTNAILLILCKRFVHSRSRVLSENVQTRLILKIANNFRCKRLEIVEKENLSEIYSQIVNAQTITVSINKSIDTAQNSIALIFLWFYMVTLSFQIAMLVLAFVIFFFFIYTIHQQMMIPIIENESIHKTEMNHKISHILDGLKELKLNQCQSDDLFHHYLIEKINQTKDARYYIMSSYAHFHLVVNASYFFLVGLTAFVLSTYFQYIIIIKVLTMLIFMWTPTLSILAAIPYISGGQDALKKLLSLTEAFGEYDESQLIGFCNDGIDSFDTIYLDNLTYQYQSVNQTPAFTVGPLSLKIHSGEILFISGGNGGGKTTLLKLISGLYQPSAGNIWIDKKKVNMTDHRYLFSAIFSDFYLFDKLYGLDMIDTHQVTALLKTMGLDKKVKWENDHFSTTDLSTGQRKRLAMIASLLENRQIYVFDEWAADQDSTFRQYFYASLLPSLKEQGKTIVVITHDDAFFHIADQRVRLNYGQLENI